MVHEGVAIPRLKTTGIMGRQSKQCWEQNDYRQVIHTVQATTGKVSRAMKKKLFSGWNVHFFAKNR